jgi:hypothetical protein
VGFGGGRSGWGEGVNAEKRPKGASDDEGPVAPQDGSNNALGAVEGNQDPEV